MYNRTILINQAIIWLTNWNYKVFLQSVNDPHSDDLLSKAAIDYTYRFLARQGKVGCALPYAIREKSNAHNALENTLSEWRHRRVTVPPEVKRMVDYYCNLSDKGFSRLSNEITRKAERRLEIKTDAYWAGKMLEKRETT